MNKCFFITKRLLGLLFLVCVCFSCGNRGGKINDSKKQSSKIIQPHPIQDVNVYLENSGSMDGYVKGNTGFEQSIYAYLTDLQISKLVDTLNLNYINSRIIPLGCDVEKFIHNIEPADFRRHGGDLGTSDIAIVLDSILKLHKKNDISIFISDCIVSPGNKYASSPQSLNNYLLEQRTKIKKSFVQILERVGGDLAVVICQLNSLFDGRFYNKYDYPKCYKGNRPFYIWLIGSSSHIKQLVDKVTLKTLQGNGAEFENVYTLLASSKDVDYRVIPGSGTFDLDRDNPKTTICNIKKDSRGQKNGLFRFPIGVNLNQLPLDKGYLLNVSNYEINNKDYSLSIKEQREGRFSHIFYLTSKVASRGNIMITLKNRFPQWVENKTDFLGDNLEQDGAIGKTYGLKYLIEGVYDAFTIHQKNYAEFKITIK